ncbi:hypothetical protein JCM6882_009450 [Rhodosporidiobolus microsporus]
MGRNTQQLDFTDTISSGVNVVYLALRKHLHRGSVPGFAVWRNRVDEVCSFLHPVVANHKVSRDKALEALAEFEELGKRVADGELASADALPSPLDASVFPTIHRYLIKRLERNNLPSHTFTWVDTYGREQTETFQLPLRPLAAAASAALPLEGSPGERANVALRRSMTRLRSTCLAAPPALRAREWFQSLGPIFQGHVQAWQTEERLHAAARRVLGAEKEVRVGKLPDVNTVFNNLSLQPGSRSVPIEINSLGSASHRHLLRGRLSHRQRLIYPRAFSSSS